MVRRAGSWSIAAACAMLWLPGCDRASASGHVVRDSAGIRIVENERAAWTDDTRWRIADAPSLDIGGDSVPGALLFGVTGARRFPDGRIAVANGGTAEVRVFDSRGRYLSTVGRRGQGPGEFASPSRVMERPGDSLLVLDAGHGFRINTFAPGGHFVRSHTAAVATGAEDTELVGWFRDGSYLAKRREQLTDAPGPDGLVRSHASLFRLGSDGNVLDSLGRFPHQTGALSGLYVWGARAQQAVHDSVIYLGLGDRYEIGRYSLRGGLLGLIRRSVPERATTAGDVDSFFLRAWGNDPGRRAAIEQRMAGARFAPTLPAYYYLMTDDPGNLWVQEYSTTIGAGRSWSVFDPIGVYLGDVEMPERFRVFEIRNDVVIGRWLDPDDVEHVRSYPIIKPG